MPNLESRNCRRRKSTLPAAKNKEECDFYGKMEDLERDETGDDESRVDRKRKRS